MELTLPPFRRRHNHPLNTVVLPQWGFKASSDLTWRLEIRDHNTLTVFTVSRLFCRRNEYVIRFWICGYGWDCRATETENILGVGMVFAAE